MSFRGNFVDQSHQAGNCSIEFQVFNIRRNFFDSAVNLHFQFFRNRFFRKNICQACHTIKEFLASFNGAVTPRSCSTIITHEQYISTKGISTIFFYDIKWIHNISFGFTHFIAIRSENQSLDRTFCIWFRSIYNAKIIQEVMPESGVDHMSGNMFHTTIIPVNRHPVFQFIHISKRMSVVRICISQEIPGRSCPLRHGISFTFCCSTTFRASAVYKRINLCKW